MKKIISIVILFFLIVIGLLMNGCTEKVYIPKYVYVKEEIPYLKTYDYNNSLKLTLKPKGEYVYIKEWNTTMSKKDFLKLYKYVSDLKSNLNKCNNEINTFNKMYH